RRCHPRHYNFPYTTLFRSYEERAEISRQPEVEWDPIKRKTVTKKDEHGNVIYRDLTDRRVQNLWDIPRIGPTSGERVNFDTQKPDRKSTRLNSSHEWISYA